MDNVPLAVQMAAERQGYTNIRKSMTKWLGNDKNNEVQFIHDDLIERCAKELASSCSVTCND